MVGQFKDDGFQNHTHKICSPRMDGMGLGGGAGQDYGSLYYGSRAEAIWAGTIMDGRKANVTRGKRKGVKYIIKVL